MDQAKFLPDASLAAWLAELSAARLVLAPRREGGAVVFKPYDPAVPLELTRDATVPPKGAVFPACEELMRYRRVKDPEKPGQPLLEVEESLPEGGVVVFGSRPCGARGFTVYDRVFDAGGLNDPYYAARRKATAFVTLACREAGSACFCHWVGSGPADPDGSDVLLTQVPGGYVVRAVTEKGAALVGSGLFSPADRREGEEAAAHAKARESLDDPRDLAPARQALLDAFDDMEFWSQLSAKCLSCGACTYLCPTCYCFNITDEAQGNEGARLRTWDNCMSFQFTLEASGHNPRPTKAHRLKNRVGHKFSYYPGLHGGAIACCGCGRCIRSCPVGVDIRQLVLAAVERAREKSHD
ncbi:Anaerobic sulfite reductase subunit A [Fundidesulfovibrio magnetotacticus]|uniref:Anaerobic sulfite reductase subunit A n=1 Tax=Fundidesulfovibrio magnetotacticus TaxID=2730080 RepID=A0A6V8LRH3_9BACT|nr:4Fe-4S dicluster domain-containing protein [Fundidesulfovibrio magnetotacticus]GFK92197.1 Anaerobic sulfite reductase subunit A [Fundidesulfovibrio magnetotacticus]